MNARAVLVGESLRGRTRWERVIGSITGFIYAYRVPLLVAGTARLWTMGLLSLVWAAMGPTNPNSLYDLLFEPWRRWDINWYLKVAAQGYSLNDGSTAFFPLYPALINLISQISHSDGLVASLFISSLASMAAFVFVYRAAKRGWGQQTADRTVMLLAAYPSAFYLWAGYTESLFLLLACLSLEALREKKWWIAGLAGGLAALARLPGVTLAFPLLVEIWRARNHPGLRAKLVSLAMIPGGLALFVAFLFFVSGDPLAFVHGGQQWRTLVLPWEPILNTMTLIGRGTDIWSNARELGTVILFAVLTGWSVRRMPSVYLLFQISMLLIPLMTTYSMSPVVPMAAMSRYQLVVYPSFVALARLLPYGQAFRIALIACTLLQGILLTQYVLWVFVG